MTFGRLVNHDNRCDALLWAEMQAWARRKGPL